MTEQNFSWEEFTHGIYLHADVDQVFLKIATAAGICSWFLGEVKYTDLSGHLRAQGAIVEAGDRYSWKWLKKDFETKGEVLDSIVNEFVRFTFGTLFWVEMTVHDEGNRTKLTLRQGYREGAKEDQFSFLNCCVCWVFFLSNLKSIIEGGNDLRELEEQEEMLVNR